MSAFTRTQVAARFSHRRGHHGARGRVFGHDATDQLAGGRRRLIGRLYPTTWFLLISRGTFAKGLGFADLYRIFLASPRFCGLTLLSVLLLKKQGK